MSQNDEDERHNEKFEEQDVNARTAGGTPRYSGDANSGHGWGVSVTPNGPIYHYDPSQFGGTQSGGSGSGQGKPTGGAGSPSKWSTVAPLAFGIPQLAGVEVAEMRLYLSGLARVQPILAGVKVLASYPALAAAAIWAVTTTPLAPGTREPTFITVMKADSLLGKEINDLPPDVKAMPLTRRVVDMVQPDGKQYIGIVQGLPERVPVVDAKPAGQWGKYWVTVPGLPVMKLELESDSRTRPGDAPGLREITNKEVCEPPLTCGQGTIDILVRFPQGSGRKPLYISGSNRLNKGSLAQRQEEERQRQEEWVLEHPYEAAVKEWEQAKKELAAAQTAYQKALSSGNSQKITQALAEVKAKEQKEKKAKEKTEAEKARRSPGKATGKGEEVGDNWLDEASKGLGAPIPKQIADKLRGRTFKDFDDFRKQFWMEVEKDPKLRKQFNEDNQRRMRDGDAPYVGGKGNNQGKLNKYHIHHKKDIQFKGPVYDMDNMGVVTPKRHYEIHHGK